MLARLQALKETIKIGIIGVGTMGKGLLYQALITPGMECVAIADIDPNKCIAAAEWLQLQYKVVSTQNEMDDAVNDGYLAICADGNMVARAASVEAVIEASSSIREGAEYALTAIKHRRHIILMNTEVDMIFGPHLMKLAQDNSVTYASCDGDQHGVIRKLWDEMRLWGFDPVMAGNIKGSLDRYADPSSIIPEAHKRDLDYKMAAARMDGTSLNIEMALVANALDCVTAIPGMYGHRAAHVNDVLNLYDFDMMHSFNKPVVDYVLGAEPGGGVFTVGFSDDSYQMDMMRYYNMGDGPYYVFHRPFHLGHVEAMEYVARAVLDDQSLMQPTHGFKTNVYTVAKRDLKAGDMLDGPGGYNAYGLIENCPPINEDWGLPICLSEGVKLLNDIPADGKINLTDVEFDPTALEFDLYFKSQKRDLVHADNLTFRPGQYTHW